MKNLIILKLGGSVITKKSEGKAEISQRNLNRLAKEIANAKSHGKFRLMVVHGAGPFGHVPAKKYMLPPLQKGLTKGQIKGFSVIHQSMEKLNFEVVEALQREGLNAIAYQPSAVGILKNRKLKSFPIDVLEKLLNLDIIPVAYGDVLIDESLGINILSGDHLVPYLAEKLNANRVIIATDVLGVFDSDPKKNKNAKIIGEINSKTRKILPRKIFVPKNRKAIFRDIKSINIGNSSNTDVTGGMKRKVLELLELANKGIEAGIISGLKPDNLRKALIGKAHTGTVIRK